MGRSAEHELLMKARRKGDCEARLERRMRLAEAIIRRHKIGLMPSDDVKPDGIAEMAHNIATRLEELSE